MEGLAENKIFHKLSLPEKGGDFGNKKIFSKDFEHKKENKPVPVLIVKAQEKKQQEAKVQRIQQGQGKHYTWIAVVGSLAGPPDPLPEK